MSRQNRGTMPPRAQPRSGMGGIQRGGARSGGRRRRASEERSGVSSVTANRQFDGGSNSTHIAAGRRTNGRLSISCLTSAKPSVTCPSFASSPESAGNVRSLSRWAAVACACPASCACGACRHNRRPCVSRAAARSSGMRTALRVRDVVIDIFLKLWSDDVTNNTLFTLFHRRPQ